MCNIKHDYCISGFEATILMQAVRKHLLHGYVPIMEKTFTSATRDRCVAQRTIYVILSGNEDTRSYINQVRNIVFSDGIYVYFNTKHTISNFMFCSIFFETVSKNRFVLRLKSE